MLSYADKYDNISYVRLLSLNKVPGRCINVPPRHFYFAAMWYAKLDNLEYNIENERRPLMNHAKHVIPMSDTSVSIKPEDIQPTVLPDAFIQSDMGGNSTR